MVQLACSLSGGLQTRLPLQEAVCSEPCEAVLGRGACALLSSRGFLNRVVVDLNSERGELAALWIKGLLIFMQNTQENASKALV